MSAKEQEESDRVLLVQHPGPTQQSDEGLACPFCLRLATHFLGHCSGLTTDPYRFPDGDTHVLAVIALGLWPPPVPPPLSPPSSPPIQQPGATTDHPFSLTSASQKQSPQPGGTASLDAQQREQLAQRRLNALTRAEERLSRRSGRRLFDVLLTTYEMLVAEQHLFTTYFRWHYVVLDEAQRIKNELSLVGQAVRHLKATHRLLLTVCLHHQPFRDLREFCDQLAM